MSAKDLLSPYLNRFVFINQQKAIAKLELCCKDGKVTVNLELLELMTNQPTVTS